jgi:ankyrin repeat protein
MRRSRANAATQICALIAAAMLGLSADAVGQARAGKPRPGSAATRATKANKEATQQLFTALGEFIPSVADVEAALKAGADVNAQDEDGWTPLMVASGKTNADLIKTLLAAKASVDMKTPKGTTALMIACSENRWMVIPVLLQGGADVNARNEAGASVLMHCAVKGGESAITSLLEAGANKDVADRDGATPLFAALTTGNGQAARALFKAGAQAAPAQSPDGFPLLALSVIAADPDSVRVALKIAPDVNGRSSKGHTPLMMASELGYAEIVADLLRAKADATLKDPEGKTALDFAQGNGHTEIVAMLSGKWPRPRLPGTTVSVPCDKLGGPVDVNLQTAAGSLGVTITYPRPLSSVLGGFYDEPGRRGYKDWSADVTLQFDTDANPKTGIEYELALDEVGTSVTIPVGTEGETKTVSGHVLLPSFTKKGGSGPDPTAGDGFYPRVRNDGGVARLEVPFTALGLAPGARIRLVAEAGLCSQKEATFQLK